jgi:integrase
MTQAFVDALRSCGAAKDRVFPDWEPPDTITHKFKEAAVAAGLPRCHLRHAWNTRIAEAGTPEHIHIACSEHLTEHPTAGSSFSWRP